jgi:hypothetical protein
MIKNQYFLRLRRRTLIEFLTFGLLSAEMPLLESYMLRPAPSVAVVPTVALALTADADNPAAVILSIDAAAPAAALVFVFTLLTVPKAVLTSSTSVTPEAALLSIAAITPEAALLSIAAVAPKAALLSIAAVKPAAADDAVIVTSGVSPFFASDNSSFIHCLKNIDSDTKDLPRRPVPP